MARTCKNCFCGHILTQRRRKKNLIITTDKYLTRIKCFQFSRKASVLFLAERRKWATACTASNPRVGEAISVGDSDRRDHHRTQMSFTQLQTSFNCKKTKHCSSLRSYELFVNQFVIYCHILYMTGKHAWEPFLG